MTSEKNRTPDPCNPSAGEIRNALAESAETYSQESRKPKKSLKNPKDHRTP